MEVLWEGSGESIEGVLWRSDGIRVNILESSVTVWKMDQKRGHL